LFEAFQTIGSWGVTVFVITSMVTPAAADPPRRRRERQSA
jgi:hypothetical protein